MSIEQRPAFPVNITESGYTRNPVRIIIGDTDYSQAMTITDAEESALAHKLWARALARGEVLAAPDLELAADEAVIEEVAAWRDRQDTPAGALSGAGELARILSTHEHAALDAAVAAAVTAERERCALLVLNHPHRINNDVQLIAAIRS